MGRALTPEQRLLRSITEAQWQATIVSLAGFGGWRWYHAPDNMPRTSRAGTVYRQNVRRGFPDLVLARGDRLVFAELKRETGTVSDDQAIWLQVLAGCGAEVAVWRPSDQHHVEDVLIRGAPTRVLRLP